MASGMGSHEKQVRWISLEIMVTGCCSNSQLVIITPPRCDCWDDALCRCHSYRAPESSSSNGGKAAWTDGGVTTHSGEEWRCVVQYGAKRGVGWYTKKAAKPLVFTGNFMETVARLWNVIRLVQVCTEYSSRSRKRSCVHSREHAMCAPSQDHKWAEHAAIGQINSCLQGPPLPGPGIIPAQASIYCPVSRYLLIIHLVF